AVLECRLHRTDGLAHDVPEEKDQDAGRGGREEGLGRGAHVLHAAERQAEEDRKPGDGAEDKRLGGAHVRVTLQATISLAVAQGHSIDEYLETIYFLA